MTAGGLLTQRRLTSCWLHRGDIFQDSHSLLQGQHIFGNQLWPSALWCGKGIRYNVIFACFLVLFLTTFYSQIETHAWCFWSDFRWCFLETLLKLEDIPAQMWLIKCKHMVLGGQTPPRHASLVDPEVVSIHRWEFWNATFSPGSFVVYANPLELNL